MSGGNFAHTGANAFSVTIVRYVSFGVNSVKKDTTCVGLFDSFSCFNDVFCKTCTYVFRTNYTA